MSYWERTTITRRAALRGVGAAGLSIAGAALIGCGGGSKPGTTPPAAGSNQGGTAAGAGPVVSERLVAIQTRDAASLDPLASQVYTTPERIGLVYPRLVYYTREAQADQSETKRVPSYVVESWEMAGDGSQLTFKLRKGVKYSNTPPLNGREFVSDDVKFSINRYMTDPASTFAARYSDVASIETPDKYTVVFKLKKPSRYILYALAAEPAFLTPPEIAKSDGDYKTKIIGPGPFIHERTTQGEGSTFKKNPDFIDAAKIYYNNYFIKVITDASTRMAALKAGEADYVTGGAGLNKTDTKTVEGPTITTIAQPLVNNSGYWFNMKNPKWADIRARTAISKAFDRQAIIDQTQQGDGSFIGPVPGGFGKWSYSDKEMRGFNAYKYDPAEAKKLWDAAGKPSQSNQTYIAPKNIQPVASVVAELIGGQLEKNLGIKSTFSTDEYSTFVNKVYNNKFDDIGIFGMVLFDPMDHLVAQYYPGGTRNGPGLNDAKVTQMIDELRGTVDDKAAVQKALDIQKHLNENVLSMAHLPIPNQFNSYSSKLQNFLPGVYPPGVEFTLRSWKSK